MGAIVLLNRLYKALFSRATPCLVGGAVIPDSIRYTRMRAIHSTAEVLLG